MFKKSALLLVMFLLSSTVALAANILEQDELKNMLDNNQPVILVDIQPAADFEKQHLPGSIETNAFPAKTAAEKARLDKALAIIEASADPVVILCPRGKSGAKNSYDYFLSKGVPEERLSILEDGVLGWPFEEMFVTGR